MRLVLMLLPASILLVSCASNDVDSAVQAARAKASIDSLWTQYAVASDQRDAAAFERLFTQDATLSFQGSPNLHGGKEIAAALAERFKNIDATRFRVVPEELKASGILAAQSGSFERGFIEADSQKTEYGRYVLIAERGSNNAWRIRRLAGFADSIK